MAVASTATELLYATDAYTREFTSTVVAVDTERNSVALAATAFFPTGGGQPSDTGELATPGSPPSGTGELVGGAVARVADVAKDSDGLVWHRLAPGGPLPAVGESVHGRIDWERRHLLMRTHTALHVLNGVIWRDHAAHVTGAHMTPGEGRLDFELPAMSQELARSVEESVNEQLELDLPVRVLFLPRSQADRDPSLIRLKANLIPRSIDPLRVIDIVGLDRQADGGTHVASTGEIGRVRIVKTESKGRQNKRVRIAVTDA